MPRIVKNIPLMDLMAFLIESADSPTHVGMIQVFRPTNGTRQEIIDRLLTGFRQGEVGAPFNYYPVFPRFGMPKWAEAESFDSDYHIRHAAVPTPGTKRQLIDMVMDLHAGIMDRSRPGWIAYIIEGLEDDCFAFYWKVHHAYIDGASAIMRLRKSISTTADDLEIRPLWGPIFAPRSTPPSELSLGELLTVTGETFSTQSKAMLDIGRSIGRSFRQAQGQLQREAPLPFSAPKSLFNKPLHATRNLGSGTILLQRFKKIASQQSVSINEVALTIVGAALDRYVAQREDVPERQLLAACPMAVRAEGDTDASTQIAAISVKLGDASMSIEQRLQQVHLSSRDAKREASEMSREALMNYLVLLGGAADLISKTRLGDYISPLTSVNVSNVAGPDYRCFMSGAEMIESIPVSTLAGGTAINITLTSFAGRMDYAVIADSLAVPCAQEIADYMADAMVELEKAVLPRKKAKAKKRAAPGKKAESSRKKARGK